MRLNFLEIHNVLSYGLDERIEFDDKLTALVGPNGAGKTNILRILTLVRDVIRRETMSPGTPEWNAMNLKIQQMCPAHESIPRNSEIQLGVTLTTDNYPVEQSPDSYLIHLLLRGIRASARAEIPPASNDSVVAETGNPNSLDELYGALRSGVIVLRHIRTLNSTWTLAYRFTNGDTEYEWTLSHLPFGPSRGTVSIAGLPKAGQPEEYKDRVTISEDSNSSRVVNYGSMFPNDERGIFLKLNQQLASPGVGSVWDELQRANIVTSQPIMAGREPGLEQVLAKVVADKIITDLDDLKIGAPATTNMEILASPDAPAEDKGQPTIPLYLAMLFRWSVGNNADRGRYTRARGIFQALRDDESYPELQITAAGNTRNVQFDNVVNDLTPNTGQPIREYRQICDYVVTIQPMVKAKDGRETPLAAIGSGGAELLRLATFLAVDESYVVLLDEPAAHLHPRAQDKLLQFLRNGDAQYVFVTHAPGLLPTWRAGLGATIRVSIDDEGFSKPCTLNGNAFDETDQLQRLVLAQPEVRAIPFADSVVFVSGQTEFIIYPQWFESIPDRHSKTFPHFVNFNGDNQFSRYLRVAHLFGIRWAVAVDGKSFQPEMNPWQDQEPGEEASEQQRIPLIVKQILEVIHGDPVWSDLREPLNSPRPSFRDKQAEWLASWKESLESVGVFTLANCWHDKKRSTETCEQCGRSVRLDPDKCEESESHPNAPHIESFEDAVNTDDRLSNVEGKFNAGKSLKLLNDYPKPSGNFMTLLTKLDRWIAGKDAASGDGR